MSASSVRPLRVLVLGGSSDATALGQALHERCDIAAVLSLAGRTREPAKQPLPTRIGGFGGAAGLAAYMVVNGIDLLVDATHPFAERMSANAREASQVSAVPLIRVERAAWMPVSGDLWREVADMDAAVQALGESPRRVFLTIGRLQLASFRAAPQHHYLVRTIDPLANGQGLPDIAFIEARPPFDVEAETCLMRDHHINALVTKNSGGAAAYSKLAAARGLGLPVVLVQRPASHGTVLDVSMALVAIDAHASARRGV